MSYYSKYIQPERIRAEQEKDYNNHMNRPHLPELQAIERNTQRIRLLNKRSKTIIGKIKRIWWHLTAKKRLK